MQSCAVLGLVAGGLWLACGAGLGEPVPELDAKALQDTSGAPIIATLQTHDGAVSVSAAGGRVRYSVSAPGGGGRSFSLEELEAFDPDVFELLQQATARGGMPSLGARLSPVQADRQPSARALASFDAARRGR